MQLRGKILCGLSALGLLALMITLWPSEPSVDVVRGVPPMSTALQRVAGGVDHMATLRPEERGEWLEVNYPNLPQDVVYYLRDLGRIHFDHEIVGVEFRYGSLDDVLAEQGGSDERVEGYFKNQLVAIVNITWRGELKTLAVIVECLNGTFIEADRWRTLQAVGEHAITEQFVIARGEGLTHHVSYPAAIDIAERFRIPLFLGTIEEGVRIQPYEARRIDTDYQQVTVAVYVGDFFDLRHMTYRKAGRQVES